MAVKSGIPTTVNGVQVGATDFSEFAVAAGLPAGITEYGIAPDSPSSVGISDVPLTPTFGDEGNYFFMTGQGDGSDGRWGFGYDAFDGIAEFGEMLIRFYYNTGGVKNRNNVGACFSLRGLVGVNPGADIEWGGGTVYDPAVSPPHSASSISIPAGAAIDGDFDIQEAEQDPEWMWLRMRRSANLADPNDDDYQLTAWYGDLEDEPANPDGTKAPNSFTGGRGLFAIGWMGPPFFSIFDQRIAFLSYSVNPSVEPPPVPPLSGATIWTPFPEVFIRNAPKPAIVNPEIEYDARTLGLSDGDPVVTWIDQSGNSNNAVDAPAPAEQPTFRADRWAPGSLVPSVEFLDFGTGPPSREESMDYDAQAAFAGSELTLFIVAQVKDLSEGAAFIGTRFGATPPREIDVCAFADGTLLFGFGTETIPTAIQTNIITAPGVIVEDELLLITCRSTNGFAGVDPEGMLIRLNGQQVASVPSFVTPPSGVAGAGGVQQGSLGRSQNTGSPELGLPGGTIWGVDRLIAWIGGYSVAASNAEIEQMESFLAAAFGLTFGTQWTDQPEVSPGTVWANIP